MNPYEFEQKIKNYIEKSGRSQAATARKLGVPPDTFNKWVRGVNRMPIEILHEFCRLVGLAENQRTELFKLAGYTVPPVITEEGQTSAASAEALSSLPLFAKPYRVLVGRDSHVAEMLTALRDPAGKRMLAVDGLGGIGKTALAREVVDRCLAERLFETALWLQAPKEEFIDLRHPRKAGVLTFDIVLDTIARQMGALDVFGLNGLEKEGRLKSLLEMQPALIILDNLETAKDPQNEIARRLLPLLGSSKAILTSRQRFQGDMFTIHLEGLDETGALAFIRQEAGEKNIKRVAAAKLDELRQMATDTGGSPLALKLVVGQLDSLDLDTVLTSLREVKIPQQGTTEDEYFRFYQYIFFSSWKLLSADSQTLLISMAHFSSDIGGTLAAIQATSDLNSSVLTHCIKELWRYSFLEVAESPTLKQVRYYLHALTQYFVLADIVRIV